MFKKKKAKRIAGVFAVTVLAFASCLMAGNRSSVRADSEPVTAHPAAEVYEAENAVLTGGAVKASDHTGYFGTGFVGGYDNSGTARTTFDVNADSAGEYYISFRYSAGDVGGWPKDRTLGLDVNDASENVTFTGTDSTWNTWEELIVKRTLKEGSNSISLYCITSNDNSDCINLDRISVWKYSSQPVTDAVRFDEKEYSISVGAKLVFKAYSVNSNGIDVGECTDYKLSSSDDSVLSVDESGKNAIGKKAGSVTVTIASGQCVGETKVNVMECPTITAYCGERTRKVEDCRFGYILTPNYDIPDSRLTLLGRLLNRETLPVQTFQSIGDLDGSYYEYEGSVKERHLEAYKRAKAAGYEWYMVMGMNPSWATASGGPMDTTENKRLKTDKQVADFKQYIKDFLQYMRDNGAKPDYADLTNEYWTGTEEIYQAAWEALREVYPDDIPAVGPGAVGYDGIPDYYIPYAAENDITVEGPSWHAFWTSDTYAPYSQLKKWYDNILSIQQKYPKANGKYIIWEENNSGSKNPADWTRSMSNVVRTGVDRNIKGCMESMNWNGMSDLLTTNVKAENSAARRSIWWVYYMFGRMSGEYTEVETSGDEAFTGAVSIDDNEKKVNVIVAKNGNDGAVNVVLNDVPFASECKTADIYVITDDEADGLKYVKSESVSVSGNNVNLMINDIKAEQSVMAVVKCADAKPGFFNPMTPDDGEVASRSPHFTWSVAQGADSYTFILSKNSDMSSPVVTKEGITETGFTLNETLEEGTRYYWTVVAANNSGKTPVANSVKYSFIASDNVGVPGQFGPYMPSVGAKNEDIHAELKWKAAYNADSYHVVVSENEDFSNPVIDKSGIKTVRSTGHFGNNSQGYYKITEELQYNTKYYWKVYAVNSEGERPMNGVLHYFTTEAEGDYPVEFSLVYPQDKAAGVDERTELIWEESPNAFFYHLEVADNEAMNNPVIDREYMIYNKYRVAQNELEPGKTYYWQVTAYTKDKKLATNSKNVMSFTTAQTPASPLLYAEQPADGDGRVTIWYKASAGADSYNIYYGKQPGVYTRRINGVKDTNYTISGLNAGQTYYFAVKAVNAYGESPVWNERKVSPAGYTPDWNESLEEGELLPDAQQPDNNGGNQNNGGTNINNGAGNNVNTPAANDNKVKKPAKVKIKKVKKSGKKALKVTWKKASCDGYRINVAANKKFNKGKKTYTVKSGKKTKCVAKKLPSGKTLYIRVQAYRKSGGKKLYGKWSKVLKVRMSK